MNDPWRYPKNRILRGALFGSGQVTQYHMQAWSQIDAVKMVAVTNRTVEKAFDLAERYGIERSKVYSSHQDLLANEEIDFVDVATAPAAHHRQVIDSVKLGKHVFCQKPFSTDIPSAIEMITEAEKANVLLSINENWRWRSWYRKLKEIIDSQRIGRPVYLYIRRHDNLTLPEEPDDIPALLVKQPYTGELERLLLFEWGIHIVDVARFLLGDADSVYATMGKVSRFFKGEDRAVLNLLTGDAQVILDLSWATIMGEEKGSVLEHVILEGERGSIKVLPERGDTIQLVTGGKTEEMPAYELSSSDEYQLSYTRTHQNFIERLRKGGLPESHGRDNLKTLLTVFAAYHSAETNRVVNLAEYSEQVLP